MLRLEFILNNHRHTPAPVASGRPELAGAPARKPPNMHDLDLLTMSIINEHQQINNNEIYSTISSCNVLIERSINRWRATGNGASARLGELSKR
eukprot:scaffold17946_cov56-Cyclotella_meneghiniana.AAC.3